MGKTLLTTALIAYWQQYCPQQRLGVFKPVQCGGDDRSLYSRLTGQSAEEINPICFQATDIPPIAADKAEQHIQLEQAWQQYDRLTRDRDFVVVEAPGSFGTPITRELTVADLAWDWRLPTVLVVPVQPGALAQSITHVALAQQARVHLKGIILNCQHPDAAAHLSDWVPVKLLQSLTQKPVLGCIPYLENPSDLSKLAQVASNLEVERLLPLLVGGFSASL